MLAGSKEEKGTGGTGLRATVSSVGSKTSGALTTIWVQQQRHASPEFVLWPPGTPEISQLAGEKTSQAINSTPVSRRMMTAAIRKIVIREGIPTIEFSHKSSSDPLLAARWASCRFSPVSADASHGERGNKPRDGERARRRPVGDLGKRIYRQQTTGNTLQGKGLAAQESRIDWRPRIPTKNPRSVAWTRGSSDLLGTAA